MVAPITSIDPISVAEFREHYAERSQPVVIRGAAADWDALKSWSFDYLRRRIGNKPAVAVRRPIEWKGNALTVAALLDLLERDPAAPVTYMHGASIPLLFPELKEDLQPLLPYTQPNRMARIPVSGSADERLITRLGFPELIIGAAGRGIGPLHYDIGHEHAFITQILGSKEFVLLAPKDTKNIYPSPRMPNQSEVDIWEPDYERFPKLSQATIHKITAHAGDTVFIPANWWHITRGLTPTIAVSLNSVSRTNWREFSAYRAAQLNSRWHVRLFLLRTKLLGLYLNMRENYGAEPGPAGW